MLRTDNTGDTDYEPMEGSHLVNASDARSLFHTRHLFGLVLGRGQDWCCYIRCYLANLQILSRVHGEWKNGLGLAIPAPESFLRKLDRIWHFLLRKGDRAGELSI